MAEMVGGFLLPHDPLITAEPEAPSEAQRKNVLDAYAVIADRLKALKVDTVVVIGDDHYTVFGPHCIPRCLIAIGDVDGPAEPWLRIPRGPIRTNTDLALHIMQTGFDNGVDWAVSKALTLDHSTTIPIHFSVQPNEGMSAVPVYINSGVMPLISSQRSYEIGKLIRKAVDSWQSDERVAIFGTGGISHWVGMAEMGQVNVEWDKKILDLVEAGNVKELIAMSDADVLDDAGNGALEIKNWITALGATEDMKAEVIAYEPVHEWVCGCGFAELKTA